NFGMILSLAFIGTAFSAFATAALVYLAGMITYPVSLLEAFTYGALIAATDPVSVLATLSSISVDRNLYICVFGESALNDAVSVILFRLAQSFAHPDFHFSTSTFLATTFLAIGVFFGSMVLGYFLGMVLSKLLKHAKLNHEPHVEVIMMFVFAYLSYIISEWLHLSGIVAILFCGMSTTHYASHNFSDEAGNLAKGFLRVLASLSETMIFVYLGLGLAAFGNGETIYNWGFIALSIVSILIARCHVFIIATIANVFRSKQKRMPMNQQGFLWYCGLRGGICFVMALQLTENDNYRPEYTKVILGTTLMTVFTTIIFFGAWTVSLLDILKLKLTEEQVRQADAKVEETIGTLTNNPTIVSFIKSFDKKYTKHTLLMTGT
ncbi:Sodium/hydrogen exchanger, partial [Rozella allomycis CSF55]